MKSILFHTLFSAPTSHRALVLENLALRHHVDGMIERLSAGDGIFIFGRREERHKSKAVSDLVRLILVKDF